MWRRKKYLRFIDIAVYAVFVSIGIYFIATKDNQEWLQHWLLFWATALVLIGAVALASTFHILKRSRPLRKIGIYPNNKQMILYVSSWLGATVCIIACAILGIWISGSVVNVKAQIKKLEIEDLHWPLTVKDFIKIRIKIK